MLLFICAGIGFYLWASGWIDQTAGRAARSFYDRTADAGFKIDNIIIEGRVNADKSDLKSRIGVDKGDPILSQDLNHIRDSIQQISWVKNVRVERRLPATLYIAVEERVPIALWQRDNKLSVVDDAGIVLTDQDLKRFSDLIILVGDDAPLQATALLSLLAAEPSIRERVEAAKWVASRRWDLILKNKTVVRLPEEDAGLALRKLSDTNKREGIMDRNLDTIDMRDASRIVIQTRPGAVQEYKASFTGQDPDKQI